MASDFIQNEYAQRARTAGEHSHQLELTRDQSFLDGRHDIFDILSRRALKSAALNHTLIETANFIERTHCALRCAEKKITEQGSILDALHRVNERDPVSGLLNREGFARMLVREIARTNRNYSIGGVLVMFSLENLHKIRSCHDQQAADQAVRLLTKALEHEIRDMDLAARTGDDAFTLLFADTAMSKALNRLQHMALRLNRLSLIWNGEEIRLNLSLGLKSYKKGTTAENVFQDARADLERNRTSLKL